MDTLESLLERYDLDARSPTEGGQSVVQHRLASAVSAIGWRAASDAPAEEVASRLAPALGACARGHRDLKRLRREMAECLRQFAHPLDGSSAGTAEWEPTAARIIELYVGDVPRPESSG